MTIAAFKKFVDGFRLINGTHLNALFQGNEQMQAVNVSGLLTAASLNVTGFQTGSVANALTALGNNRGTSLALTKAINNVTTAAASTGVTLPSAATVGIGGSVIIYNGGASPIQVYGAGADTIDTVAAATGVPLTNAKRCIYTVVAANTWISAQLGVVSA